MGLQKKIERYITLEIKDGIDIIVEDSCVKPKYTYPKFYEPGEVLGGYGKGGRIEFGDVYVAKFANEVEYETFRKELVSVYGFLDTLNHNVTEFSNYFSMASLIDIVNFLEQSSQLKRLPANPWLDKIPKR